MTDTTPRNLLGIPISGEIRAGSTRVEQYPQSQFEDLVRRILDDPYFVDFGWTQYTPYFNDGDPCEFSVTGLWVRTIDDVKPPAGYFSFAEREAGEVEEYDEDDLSQFEVDMGTHPSLGGQEWPNGYRAKPIYVGSRESQWRLAWELNAAIDGGHFDNVLLDLFGDHCQVRVTRNGITIDEYSHD